MASSYLEIAYRQSPRPENGKFYRGTIPLIYSILRELYRTAGRRPHLATEGYRDIEGRLPVMRRSVQTQ
jgi:hypothetical protein